MRHAKAGRQLRRTGEQKLALMRGLAMSLIQHGAIETTEAKAKELRPFVEKLITRARSGTLHDRRQAARHIQQRAIADMLFAEDGPKFQKRAGGYTRILKLGHRKGDPDGDPPDRRAGNQPVVDHRRPDHHPQSREPQRDEQQREEADDGEDEERHAQERARR